MSRNELIDQAVGYLGKAGLRVLDRDWHDGDGVIDIAAVEHNVFVVCDVKTRSRTRPGPARRWKRSARPSAAGCAGSRSSG